ncbi:MAG: ATP-binding protein [Conexivisphaerales archaeon]
MGSQSAGTITEQFDLFLRSWKSADGSNKYITRIDRMIADGQVSVVVDYEDLLSFDTELATALIENPDRILSFFREAALQVVRTENLAYAETIEKQLQVRIAGLIDKLPLRGVSAKYLDRLVAINGMVVRTSEIKPRVVVAAFACPNEHITYVPQLTNSLKKPDKCSECNEGREFRLETKLSRFTDFQVIRLQELPEELPPGQLPQSLDAELLGDLVNRARPGDRIVITGIVRAEPESGIGAGRQSTFRTRLDANYIDVRGKELEQIQITPEDEAAIRRIAESPRAYDDLVRSIAPAIYGMEAEKEAALLLVAGAPQRTLPDGTTLRGDINALIVGDPGCLVGDERVVLADGSIVKIENLGSEHLQPINIEVLTDAKGRDRATVFHKYRKQRVIEIITETGKSIKGTPNHPLLALQNGVLVWKRLDQLNKGDTIAAISRIPCRISEMVRTGFPETEEGISYPKYFDLKFAAFIGYMLSHGWVDETKGRFGFKADYKVKDALMRYVEQLYGLRPHKLKESEGNYLVEYVSKAAADTLRQIAARRVPDGIMKSGNRVVKQFLRWLFKGNQSKERIVLEDKNVELLRDVQILLLRFSIQSCVKDGRLEIDKENAKYFENVVLNMHSTESSIPSRYKRNDGIVFERIAEVITSKDLMDVYDIEVPATHRFIANGIISHNTGKSELLKYVARLAPRGLYTSGRGSTAAGLCVAPDSLVLTPSGPKEIKEIVEHEMREGSVRLDPRVERSTSSRRTELLMPLTYDIRIVARSGRNVLLQSGLGLDASIYGHATSYYRLQTDQVIRVRTSLGKTLGATPETRVVCFDPCTRVAYWKEIGSLEIGNWVVMSSYIPEVNSDAWQKVKREIADLNAWQKMAYLAGVCTASSWVKRYEDSLLISFERKKLSGRLLDMLADDFGAKVYSESKTHEILVRVDGYLSEAVSKLLHFDEQKDVLNLGSAVLNLAREEVASFLSGLADFAAVVDERGVELRIPNLRLAREIEAAMMRFGILCRVRESGSETGLSVADPESLKRFLRYVASAEMKKKIAEKGVNIDSDGVVRIGEFYVAARVEGVEKCKEKVVYDLTVDEGEAFIANGFLVHNTAAVVKEKSGLMMLEAGAVVLADLGVACIDEFDKMRPDDRGVLHEVMEQQTVSVAKGGIVATLNARTSIVAAANPLLGTYDPFKNIYENVNLPIPLLSRFDIIFIVKDTPDRIVDEKLATHILRTHRSKGFVTPPPIDFELLRKYIVYCKKIDPVLTQEAESKLLDFYLQMRSIGGKENMITVTPRQLESLIRLATARARLMLRDKVTEEDALVAISLVRRMLSTVGIDVRTGKIDIGVLSGRASSERSLIELAMDVFKELQGPEKAPVSLSSFTDALEKTGKFSKDEARKMINMLYKMGQIYEIRPGYYSRIA